jgi:aspartyl-tRNA(Asn)/glutamyl-tRNA(Gln) amidotransferase subunit B
MDAFQQYETVVGLEVHVRLITKTKLFCADSNSYGDRPNTHISPITLAHPGTLPKINRKAIEYAIKVGLACHCEIEKENFFARKNYFYPDLPKGYQITQHTTPICKAGFIQIKTVAGEKNIRLNRIHLEEDAGKSIHDIDPRATSIDYNRAGTPLVEIVTEPDLRSGEEAWIFLSELRKLVRYLEISDGNMEEGSLRCDANISIRKKGEIELGTKVEVKNLNSMRNVRKAIDHESNRLMDLLYNGKKVARETRSFDAASETTFSIREKEEAEDYRYFAEPDLPPFHLTDKFINDIAITIPVLQSERILKYISEFHLSEYDAIVLTENRSFSDYFEEIVKQTKAKAAANWMLGPVKSWLNSNDKEMNGFPIPAKQLARLINLVEDGVVSFSIASSRLFLGLLNEPLKDPLVIAKEANIIQQSDVSVIGPVIDKVLERFPEKVNEYKKGKKGLLALFVGEVMKQTKGSADPVITNQLLIEKLKS